MSGKTRTKPKILLVDDEETILEVFSTHLRSVGFDVVTGHDGEEALKLVHAEKPDCLVLDILMPKLDGWQACERIKSDPKTSGLPVIFLTAFNQAQDRQRARRLCVQGYLTKPCDPADLEARLREVLKPIIA